MFFDENKNFLEKFGINEIYFYEGLPYSLLEKLSHRAALSLDNEDTIVLKNVTHDMILIFYHQIPSQSVIYRFLKFLSQNDKREIFIKSNTLLNEDELFEAIKTKTFVLITPQTLSIKN